MSWLKSNRTTGPAFRVKKKFQGLRSLLFNHLFLSRGRREIIQEFHKLYYDSSVFGKTWEDTRWLGLKTWKLPSDLWVYQEIIWETRPKRIIETGTAYGGSALYLAGICDALNHGRVVTIDIEQRDGRPTHPRIEYLHGSSTDPAIVARATAGLRPGDSILVILDSDHTAAHVLAELRAYAPFIARGGYLIVEDTNMNGHPVYPEWGPGPMEGLENFLQEDSAFVIDPSREKFLITFNPRGFLKRRG